MRIRVRSSSRKILSSSSSIQKQITIDSLIPLHPCGSEIHLSVPPRDTTEMQTPDTSVRDLYPRATFPTARRARDRRIFRDERRGVERRSRRKERSMEQRERVAGPGEARGRGGEKRQHVHPGEFDSTSLVAGRDRAAARSPVINDQANQI